MPLLPTQTLSSTPQQHLDDHNLIHPKLNDLVNVKRDYGATGDGATNDTAAINAAIAAGGEVFFPRGTYVVLSSILANGNNVRLRGEGPASVLKAGAGWTASDPLIQANNSDTGVENLTIEYLQVDGNHLANIAIEVTGTANEQSQNRIQFCDITRFLDRGVHARKAAGHSSYGTRVHACHIQASANAAALSTQVGIYSGHYDGRITECCVHNARDTQILLAGGGWIVSGNHLFCGSPLAGSTPSAIKATSGGLLNISGNYIDSPKSNHAIIVAPTVTHADSLIEGNTIISSALTTTNTYSPIKLDDTSATITNIGISGNVGKAASSLTWKYIVDLQATTVAQVNVTGNTFRFTEAPWNPAIPPAMAVNNTYSTSSGGARRAPTFRSGFALTNADPVAVDAATGNEFTITLTADRTIAAPTNPVTGQIITFLIKCSGTPRTVTWDSVYLHIWGGIGTANKTRTISFRYDGTNWIQVGAVGPDV